MRGLGNCVVTKKDGWSVVWIPLLGGPDFGVMLSAVGVFGWAFPVARQTVYLLELRNLM